MGENIKANPIVAISNMEQKQSPAFALKNDCPNKYFDDSMHCNTYYGIMCISCQHWIDGVCNFEQGICNYAPF